MDAEHLSAAQKILRSISNVSYLSSSRKNSPVDLPTITITKEENQKQIEQLEFDKSVKSLMKGCQLIKVNAGPRMYKRLFFLDPDYTTVFYHEPYGYRYRACKNQPRTVDLHTVKEVRVGYKSDVLLLCSKSAKFKKKYPEQRCFSFIFAGGKTLNLIAPTIELCKSWFNVAQHIIDRSQHENREARLEKWLRRQFKLADTSNDGFLNFEECMRLLDHLNLQFSRDEALKYFQGAGAAIRNGEDQPVLDSNGFHRLYTKLSERPDLRALFEEHASIRNSEYWTLEDLQNFLQNVQMEDNRNVEACEFIIKTFEPLEENQKQNHFSITGFRNYLLNQRQFLFHADHRQVYQDMSYPLKDYFIASSHNTYLMSNQLTGESSIEAYVSCFQKGCRCVELDCWDGPDGEPIITHGRTLTSNIYFHDVISVVKDYGFRSSQYPVILSFENHCSVKQQDVMATHLRNILQDMLYTDLPKDADAVLPAPEQLKGRVLVKSTKHTLLAQTPDDDQVDDDPSRNLENGIETRSRLDGKTLSKSGKSEGGEKNKHAKLSVLLSNEIFLNAVKFKGYEYAKTTGRFYEMSSLSESKCRMLYEKSRDDLLAHCRHQLVRVYPDGKRTDSTNYDPIPMLRAGCQIVAMNYQDRHPEMQIYKAMFMDNGGCGYLLKPEYMRKPAEGASVVEKRKPMNLKVTVVSAQHLPKPDGFHGQDITDPFVVAQITGCERDCRREKTVMVHNNGFNPIWNQVFDFVLHEPEFAVFRLEVRDQDSLTSEMIAHYTIPVSCMQQGYRHVELFDKNDLPLEPATLFIRVQRNV